jgi:acetyl-CoA carboxylase alpha subunit
MFSDPDGPIPLIEEWDTDLRSADPLGFPGYSDRLGELDRESVRTGRAERCVVIEGDFDVLGGSMGLVHGEKVVRAFDRAVDLGLPVVAVTRSGGARMQEGMVALVQMARVSAAIARHQAAGLLSVALHRSPTTGGVFASYGSLCDVRAVESGAVIGFAGPRVVAQTTGEEVEGSSHSAETALAAGLVDTVLRPEEVGAWLSAVLAGDGGDVVVEPLPTPTSPSVGGAGKVWEEIERARATGRPSGAHVARSLVDSWVELGGGTDPTVRAGLAAVDGRRLVVVATDRYAGHGRPGPSGYRLAQRAIGLAGRLGLPLVSLVDMPGADPGSDPENGGIAGEIARTFAAMATTPAPSLAVCVGEGGSGGALALAAADVLLIQEHAIFSVIAPEGAAAILHRDASLAPEVAPALKLTSRDLVDLGVVDGAVGDTTDAVVDAVRGFLAEPPPPGRRLERFDAATERWLRRA